MLPLLYRPSGFFPTAALLFSALMVFSCSPRSTDSTIEAADGNRLLVESPDQALQVQLSLNDQAQAFYTILRNDTVVLQPSRLGVRMEDADFTTGLSLAATSAVESVEDRYELLTAKRKNNTYKANKRTFHLLNAAGDTMQLLFQVSNDGVAFRYHFPGQSAEKKKITDEITSFQFPQEAKAWLQPMSEAKTGWKETNPSYEEYYQKGIAVGTPAPTKAGWVYPALFQTGHNWVLITESGTDGDYSGTRLHQSSSGGNYTIDFPQAPEDQPGGILNPESSLPWSTPWRILAIGSLKTIAESTLGTDLAKPAIALDQSFIKPGKASWSWAILKDDSTIYSVQKRFIDYAADMNWQYTLIDADWDQKIGYEKVKELADYAKTKDVKLLLWYNSAGDWNSTPYTPKSKLLTREARMKEFGRLQEMGIAGVKIDFFGGDGQSVMQYYTDILKDAAANKLLVNFHGSTLPRGWHRTYPNLMTMEAIKGFEFITFEQQNADEAPAHATVIPFTRNAFDPMDFTPLSLHVIPGINRKTTLGHELALPVLFISGIQHYAETANGMKQVPEYVREYLRNIPLVWEDTHFVQGYPGQLAIIARKAGDRWYVAGVNGENTPKTVSLDLSFIGQKQGTLLTDGKGQEAFQNKAVNLAATPNTEVDLKPNGGFVMIF